MKQTAIGRLRADKQSGDHKRQRAHLTFRGNVKTGRHGWLRLTPAYSLHVVNEILEDTSPNELILDPFSGTGTTPLAATIHGVPAHSIDINPFLVWLGNLKLKRFPRGLENQIRMETEQVLDKLRHRRNSTAAWMPKLHQIEKWWARDTLIALSNLYEAIGETTANDDLRALLQVAFCKVLISTSNASFGHQSMSFKKQGPPTSQKTLFDEEESTNQNCGLFARFADAVCEISDSLVSDVPTAAGQVFIGDSRRLDDALPKRHKYTKVITSPPYPNRMSYVRELRPYMYWLGFLSTGRQAGELDWQAIGGTWGCATSNLSKWQPSNGDIAFPKFDDLVRAIASEHEILGRYVHRYFDDVKLHIQSLRKVVAAHAKCFYVVGNSKFYDTILPVQEIYAALFEDAGFLDCGWEVIRKRNSKKELFEFVVHAVAPA